MLSPTLILDTEKRNFGNNIYKSFDFQTIFFWYEYTCDLQSITKYQLILQTYLCFIAFQQKSDFLPLSGCGGFQGFGHYHQR